MSTEKKDTEKRKPSSKRSKDKKEHESSKRSGKDREKRRENKDGTKPKSSHRSKREKGEKGEKEKEKKVKEVKTTEPEEAEEEYEEYLPEDDDVYGDMGDGGLADSGLKESTWKFLSPQQFVDELLETAVQDIGPYVPFMEGDDEEVPAWKCLNVLRALSWNLGRVEEVLDNQDKIFKKAGILEEPKKVKKQSSKFTCSVCEEEVKLSDTSALECQHRFCNDCWGGAVSAEISSSTWQQLFGNLNCLHKGCNLTILGCLIKKVVPDKEWQHYLRMLVRSYLDVNSASYSQCPTTNCGRIAKANYKSRNVSKVVTCECGDQYCFQCNMAPHVPASCRDLEKWKAKDSDDEASLNLIKATTTQCPKCGRALDRITACNHITCGCSHQFCFVCKGTWGSCSIYSCSKYKTVEESEKASGKEFAPGYKTASDWLVQHERFVAFSKKVVHAKQQHDKYLGMKSAFQQKSLDYREKKPGGNPQFITDGWAVLVKSWHVLHYTFIWGFWNIPPTLCAQKSIYEWQIKNYEKLLTDLQNALAGSPGDLDHLKTKHLYTLIESNLIKKIEEAEDLLSLFSEKSMGKVESQSVLARWTCANPSCNYSNHPVEQEKNCGHCGQARPEVKIVWFSD